MSEPRSGDTGTLSSGTLLELVESRVFGEHRGYQLIGFFDRAVRDFKTVSQHDFFRHAAGVGRQLSDGGLGAGDVALIVGGSPESQLLAYFGSIWIGARPAIHPARPTTVGARRTQAVRAAVASLPRATKVVMEAGSASQAMVDELGVAVVAFVPDEPRDRLPVDSLGGRPQPRPDDVVHVQLSSGTTRASRAVAITNRNLFENFESVRRPWDLRPTMKALSWLPLGHDLGLIGGVLLPLLAGGDIYLLSPFDMLADPLNWIGSIAAVGATFSPSPNFGFDQAVRRIDPAVIRGLDLSSWTTAPCGGEPVQAETVRRFIEAFAPARLGRNVVTPSYGLAEITLCATAGSFTESWSHRALAELMPHSGQTARPRHIELVNCGRPVSNVEVRLVDPETGLTIEGEGRPGEIVVRGTPLAAGYLAADGSPVPFEHGEFRTGDVGVFHHGDLYIVDRINNVIIRNAENLPASHVEAQIASAVGVSSADVMVVELDIVSGRPRLVAVVELGKDTDPASAIDAYMAGQDDLDLRVDDVYFVGRGVLPTTTSGKKQHLALKQLLADGALKYKEHLHTSSRDESHGALGSTDEERILAVLRAICRSQGTSEAVHVDAHLTHDLALNSLDLFELAVALENELAISLGDDAIASLRTVADVLSVCRDAAVIDLADATHRGRPLLDRIPQINLVVDEQRGRLVRHEGRWLVDFASCNYLGLDLHPDVIAAVAPALREWGVHPSWTHAVASPRPYIELEQRLAELVGAPDTVVFPTVTLLHLGVLPRLAGAGGTILVDSEAHNSIHEAALLARSRGSQVVVFPHDDLHALATELEASRPGPRVIAIDGVYSMSGESPDLRRYQELARRHDAVVYVDDAHGIGVLGAGPTAAMSYGFGGGGVVRHQNATFERIVYVGGMSKAFSSMAAFVTCASAADRALVRSASTLVFGGPIPVASLASGLAALDVNAREGDELRARIHRLTKRLIDGVATTGLVTDSDTYFPIVNVPLGNSATVMSACDVLWKHGIIITPSVFPAAPLGRGGVRFSITAANDESQIDRAIEALDEVAGSLRQSGDLIDLSELSDAQNLLG